MRTRRPIVFVISGPSGSGKSTLVSRLLRDVPNLLFSVSYTTRAPRGAEQPGQNYHYITRQEFESRLRRGEFLEWAEVFGHYYGTHRGYLDRAEAEGRDLVLDIDVQGARQLKGSVPDAVFVFVLAPSRRELERRLRARSEDAGEVIERRLCAAAQEVASYSSYEYVLVNRDLEESAQDLAAIVKAERRRRSRIQDELGPMLAEFGI